MLRLRDIMITDVLTVSPETSLREAMEIFGQQHVSGAPVVSGDMLVGVVTGTDLMEFASNLAGVPTERQTSDGWDSTDGTSTDAEVEADGEAGGAFFADLWDNAGADVTERMASFEGPEWNVLEEHDVDEIMTRPPLATLHPDASVQSAAQLMIKLGIHRVLITEGDKLVGIVTTMDVARAAADGKLSNRTYVFGHARGV